MVKPVSDRLWRCATSYNPPQAKQRMVALMPGPHEGYVGWEKSEAIRRMVCGNIPTSRHQARQSKAMRCWRGYPVPALRTQAHSPLLWNEAPYPALQLFPRLARQW